jgi:hypothetical protein
MEVAQTKGGIMKYHMIRLVKEKGCYDSYEGWYYDRQWGGGGGFKKQWVFFYNFF